MRKPFGRPSSRRAASTTQRPRERGGSSKSTTERMAREGVMTQAEVRQQNRETLARRVRASKQSGRAPRSTKVTRRWAPLFAFSVVGALAMLAVFPAYAQLAPSSAGSEEDVQVVTGSSATTIAARDGISSINSSGRQPGGTNYTNNPNSLIQWPFHETWPFGDMFGPRETGCDVCSSFEYGIDIMAPEGTAIFSIADGVVTDVNPADDNGYGVHVTVDHVINGEVFQSNYNHMLEGSIVVQLGQTVKLGDTLGQVGNTGSSSAPHTCFLILIDGTPVDPYPWMLAHNV